LTEFYFIFNVLRETLSDTWARICTLPTYYTNTMQFILYCHSCNALRCNRINRRLCCNIFCQFFYKQAITISKSSKIWLLCYDVMPVYLEVVLHHMYVFYPIFGKSGVPSSFLLKWQCITWCACNKFKEHIYGLQSH
jgi:hypothetical protein